MELDKTHYNDAIVISGINTIKENPTNYFYYKQFRKKKRSLHESIPRKGRTQKNVLATRISKNTKCRRGFYLGDKVRYENQIGWIYGFAGGEQYGKECVVRDINGDYIYKTGRKSSRTIDFKSLVVICHNNNWIFT
ncbi:MAG: hypothetical protein PHX40_04920 [Bacilli bacterium]|nr:hypothetical protein [Bacilli bacterium]